MHKSEFESGFVLAGGLNSNYVEISEQGLQLARVQKSAEDLVQEWQSSIHPFIGFFRDGGRLRLRTPQEQYWIQQKSAGSNFANKEVVFGLIERDGNVKAEHVKSAGARVLLPRIHNGVEYGTTIYSDQAQVYKTLHRVGYFHDSVNHSIGEYGRGLVHTNTIEGFWSQLKRSIDGTYHCVSAKYLQLYLNEFVYRYNHRKSPVFPGLIASAARRVR